MDKIEVSILCAAYNHEKYIRETLEGFVNQKTNFKYEVLINDDCSTDYTASIIKEYEQKHPNIIKPLYQTENQYSKGVAITQNILLPLAKGKYIALCEGDDYWIDENKLQKQYDFMEKHPECTFCFTDAIIYDMADETESSFMSRMNPKFVNEKNIYNLGEFLEEFAFIPTASFFYCKANYNKFPKEFDEVCYGGDRKISLYSVAVGKALFINEQTCVYRVNVPNSATTTWKKANSEITYKIQNSFINLYNNIDKFTKYNYTEKIKPYILKSEMYILVSDYKKYIYLTEIADAYKSLSAVNKLKVKMYVFFPHVFSMLVKIKQGFKKK